MDHSFVFGGIDKAKCAKCHFDFITHSNCATCEACGKIGKVNVMGEYNNPKRMVLCSSCEQAEIKAAVESHAIDVKENGQTRVDIMLAFAREQDAAVWYNGDFFNAKILALEEIRTEINSSELSTDEKAFKFQSYLASRIEHLKKVVFDLDEKKHQAIIEEQVCRKSLREQEKDLRKEIREKLKEIDSQYNAPEIKQVKPKVKKATTGTFDRLVEAFMMLHSCSKEQALEEIRKGSGGKLGNLPI